MNNIKEKIFLLIYLSPYYLIKYNSVKTFKLIYIKSDLPKIN